jgi:hypothetical protein
LFCALAGVPFLVLASSSLIINEILYDPAGTDAGHEFVELLCLGPQPCALDAVSLQFINGSDPARPRLLWSAEGSQALAAGERFVLGESEVTGTQVQLTLGLQNGPDALRLWRADELLDAVAWGPLAGLGEGAPAEDVSEQSLARVPDGIDSDDNLSDFEGRAPTPTAPNSFDHAVEIVSAEATPAWLQRAGEVVITVGLRFVGDRQEQQASLGLALDGATPEVSELRGAAAEEQYLERSVRLFEGPHELEISTQSSSGHADSLALSLQAGPSGLALSELLPAPRSPEPEWIELLAAADAGGQWFVADRASSPRAFELRPGWIVPAYVLLAEDCAALRAFHSIPDSVDCLELEGGWITLNNGASEPGAAADRVRLYDARGAVVDEFAYGASADVPVGRSYERSSATGVWLLSPGEPTPGRTNDADTARLPVKGLAVTPEILSPDGDGIGDVLHVVLRPGEALTRIEAAIIDLGGETVCELGEAVSDGRYLRWSWSGVDTRGRPLDWGAYVVLVRGQAVDGAPRRWRSLFALGRRR